MKPAAFIALVALLMPFSAQAVMIDGNNYPDEWFACTADSDCTPFYACEDIGINKNYVDAYQEVLTGCDASAIHDANAKAGCVSNICAIVSTPPAAAPPLDDPDTPPADSPTTE